MVPDGRLNIATYGDFLRTHTGEKARLRRLYWIFGEEEIFRLLVLDHIKEMTAAQSFNVLRLSTYDTPETEIWAALNQHPLDTDQKRLIVVHDAQRLEHKNRMIEWVKDNQTIRRKSATAVFVSRDSEWEDDVRSEISKSTNAQYVRCALPKDENDRLKRAVEIICSWGNGQIDRTSAGVLALRVNFDMAEARSVLQKATLFPGSMVNVGVIEKLAPLRMDENIIWSLLALDKRRAAMSIPEVSPNNIGKIIGTLSTHVAMLGQIHRVLPTTTAIREVAKRVDAREQYVRHLIPHARHYPRFEVNRRIDILTRMDRAWQRGEREGVLESLVALW